jgi:hypothetical protein
MARSINWLAIRTAYIVKGWSAQKCANEFGVDPTTIKKRASKEGWTTERHQNTTAAVEAATTEAKRLVEEAFAEDRDYAARMLQIASDVEEDLAATKAGRGRIEARRSAVETMDRALRASRLVKGLKDGQASEGTAEEKLPGKKYVVAIDGAA